MLELGVGIKDDGLWDIGGIQGMDTLLCLWGWDRVGI